MLFNLNDDHHLQTDLARQKPEMVDRAMSLLESWYTQQMMTSKTNVDPLMTVIREGGPFYTRGYLPRYIERLNTTGRAHHARRLAQIHPEEIKSERTWK
jgi:hypothetical protein